jgi:hypothetical protein
MTRTCPVTKKSGEKLTDCKIPLRDIPKECLDRFELAFRFYGVK